MQNNLINGDKLGPRNVIKAYNSELGVWAYLVIDNTTLGPGKGGIRMTPTVNEEEVSRLARAMTLKNALANIPFGGAKSGIAFDPKTADAKKKKKIIEWFAKELKPVLISRYIAGPDVNMAEGDMAVFVKAAGNKRAATGKPKKLGGLPHELGSTGFGVAEATQIALTHRNLPVKGATVAIEGFGNVGVFAAKFLSEMGCKIVADSDSRGTVFLPAGFNIAQLIKIKAKTGSVVNYPGAEKLSNTAIFELPIDVLIPAALPDVINEKNVGKVKAKIIVEGANIPMREEFEVALHKRGVLIVPDITANAGGVISSYAEHMDYKADRMFKMVKEKVSAAVRATLAEAQESGITPRTAALAIALKRLKVK